MERVIVPKLDLQTQEIEIVKWHKHEGDRVKEGEPLLEISTEKATIDIEAPASGVLGGIAYQAGDMVKIGNTLAYVYADGEQAPAVRPVPKPAAIRSTPLARKLCIESSVTVDQVFQAVGLEPVGEREVRLYLASKRQQPGQNPDFETSELSPRRKIIARRMQESAHTIPHIYLFGEANIGRLELLKTELSMDGVRITLTDLIMKILAAVLREFPQFNARTIGEGAGLALRRYRTVNLGLAVSTDQGLVVPVVKDVARKTITQLVTEKAELVSRARANKLSPEDISEGTFTVSNLGMHAVSVFTALINPPEVAILAVGAGRSRLVLDNGNLVSVPVAEFCLGIDHRVLDGADGGRFIDRLKELLEEPPISIWKGEAPPDKG